MERFSFARGPAQHGVDQTASTACLVPFASRFDSCGDGGMIGHAKHPELGCASTQHRADLGFHIGQWTLNHSAECVIDATDTAQGRASDSAGEAAIRPLKPPEGAAGVHGGFEIEALVERMMKQLGGSQAALPAGRFGALFLWRSGHGRLVAACRIAGQRPHAGGRAPERKCPAQGRAFQSLRAA